MGTQIMNFVADAILVYLSPFAGFAIVDILNCIRTNKPFWLPSKIIAIAFIWALGWGVAISTLHY